ncbi:MAG: helix-turn-helix transcriptional regulator [Elusimicrobia bacterium]|nr:helix-turn-helix transcriptional regulator [Elusimicrobiota bacterium]
MTTKAPESPIGSRVRELRHERRWTQQRLAALLGITQGHLSQLERGNASFTADQLLTLLKHFNVQLDYFSPEKASAGSQLQNALARQGAAHLVERQDILPSERLKNAAAVIRETLVSADSPRQIAALAPVLVDHAGQINLTRLRNELAELGLENRFGWAIETTREAIERESAQVLPREWRIKYRRAALIIDTFVAPFILLRPTGNPNVPAPFEVLDPGIASPETLKEVIANLSPLARKWKIATRIEVDDFVNALRGARGAD